MIIRETDNYGTTSTVKTVYSGNILKQNFDITSLTGVKEIRIVFSGEDTLLNCYKYYIQNLNSGHDNFIQILVS